ncbi:MAG: hypothetical protein JNJ77_19890 [Planctomycetia bacterium]|nr:hypothetical protein [Planctomycetia bacterium]
MEIQIKATDQITKLDGVECRLWEGVTSQGVPCKVFVHRVAVHNSQDSNQFEQELHEHMPPGRFVPLSQVL